MATKEVLVEAFSKKRCVKFVCDGQELSKLKEATIKRFSDKGLSVASSLSFEITSSTWPGQWVELVDGDDIPDKSHLRVSVDETQDDIPTPLEEGTSSDLASLPVTSQARLNVRAGQWTLQKRKIGEVEEQDRDKIMREARIYVKEPLSDYRHQLNRLAGEICLRDPSLLTRKGELVKLAQKALNEEGYQYKKGRSRSKVFGSDSDTAPKRPKLSEEYRQRRLQQIQEENKSINTRISFKEKRVELASRDKNFKLCDQLTEEIAELQKQRRVLESEMRGLMKKEKKAKWYKVNKDKKLRSSSPVSSDSETATARSDSSSATVTPAAGGCSSVETPPRSTEDASRRRSLPPSHTKAYENKRSKSTPPQSYSFSADFECTESILTHDSGSTTILSDSSNGGDGSGDLGNQGDDGHF